MIVRYVAATERPGIHNVGVASRTDTTADIVGTLITNGVSEATVTLYWATTDYTNNVADWVANGFSAEVGPYDDGAIFTNTISGLSAHTTYYWNHSAVNPSGTVWAAWSGSPSFRTLGPPSVDNAEGTTAVSATIATLHGTLLDGAPADVYLDLWADESGVTNRLDLGSRELGAFSVQATGLTPDTTYGYRCFVSNDYGTAWADASASFTTLTTAYTDGNVTWSGAGAVPYWELAANWEGNEAPAKTTTGTLTFPTADTSVLDGDYTVGSIAFVGSAANHVVNLDGKTLTVGGIAFSGSNSSAGRPRGRFTGPSTGQGTLRVGTTEATANIALSTRYARLLVGNGVTLGGNIGAMNPSSQDSIIDLRGSVMENGILMCNTITFGRDAKIYLDHTTDIDTLRIKSSLSNSGVGTRYFGNPGDTVNYALPPNLNIVVGSDAAPAFLDVGIRTGTLDYSLTAYLNASTGGSFTGRLSRLRVAHDVRGGSGSTVAFMKLAGMDACDIKTTLLSVGALDNEAANAPVKGYLSLPTGTVTAGNLVVGRDRVRSTSTMADLLLDGTHVQVTNSVLIDQSGIVTVNLDGHSGGLDVDADASFEINRTVDGGGKLHIEFTQPPDPSEEIYWGLRLAGDRKDDLMLLAGLGALTSNFDAGDPAFEGKQVGVLFDDGFTYFAMADEDAFPSDPVASTRDRTFEVETGGTVTISPADINLGSFDPLERDFTLTMNYGAQTALTELELDDLGPHTVTLVITIDDEPSDTAQADATVTLIDIIAGTDANLTWTAGASTELMNRREWFWGANWDLNQPPLNPSGVKLNIPLGGTSIAAPEDGTALEVGEITFDDAVHTVDLDGNTVTTGDIRLRQVFVTPQGIFTGPEGAPGILRVGKPGSPAGIRVSVRGGQIKIGDGVTLGGHIGTISTSGQDSILDLRGAVMEDGLLEMDAFSGGRDAYCYIDDTTHIERLRVRTQVLLSGVGGQNMGDPASPDRVFPTDLAIEIGSDATPAILDVGVRVSGHNYMPVAGYFNASTGGSFTGRLSRLQVGHNTSAATTGSTDGFMKLAGMNGCDIVTQNFNIGTTTPAMAEESGAVRGLVSLPVGTVQAGTLVLGRDWVRDAGNYADLVLNGTRFAVTNAATIHGSGMVTITIGATPGGLLLTEAATLDVNGKIHITFNADPEQKSEPHYGLRWEGDHVAALETLVTSESIVIDDSALTTPASIYLYQGVTYLGSAVVPGGSLFLLR